MARTGKLSAIEALKATGPPVLHDGGGLYLPVSKTEAKSWVFRFQIDGNRHRSAGLAADGNHGDWAYENHHHNYYGVIVRTVGPRRAHKGTR